MNKQNLKTPIINAVVLGMAATGLMGCLADAGESDDLMGEGIPGAQPAISGGTVAVDGDFDAVVTWGYRCTGTKIGPRRFLTAAHCFDSGPGVGNTVAISNSTGSNPYSTLTFRPKITAVHIHPTWRLSSLAQNDKYTGAYDIAMFDVDEDTNEIPVMAVSNRHYGDGSANFRAVGYGLDTVTSADSGSKQWATLAVSSESYWLDTSGYPIQYERGAYAHNIVGWTNDNDDVESGDSGGPFLHEVPGLGWQVSGVNAQRYLPSQGAALAPFSFGARVANVYRWIHNPIENDFSHGARGTLINAKSAMCPDLISDNSANGDIGELDLQHCAAPQQSYDSQYWRLLYRYTSKFGKVVSFMNGQTGRCMSTRSPGYGNGVAQFNCDSSDSNQRWYVASQGDGTYLIKSGRTGACMQMEGGSSDTGTRIIVDSCFNADKANRSWVFAR